ncbi:50S ribosomal protein L10 [Candidatus Micrarchaeota archaeon]|jgi:large subunit ribosomal protein L10|nr:50S ribosomal protein L10 [Candidatus Micrarchaeota archaeon]
MTERPAIIKKKEQVEKFSRELSDVKLIALIRLRNLPDNIFQGMKRRLRGKAKFLVGKSTVIKRALENTNQSSEILNSLNEPVAVIYSNNMSSYELYQFFKQNKEKVPAKPGQIAPFDIIVPAGETDLLPGPALSELKTGKINAQVKAGKIVVAKDSVVAKEGEKISDPVAKALRKVNVLPFEVGIQLLLSQEEGLIYKPEILEITSEQLTLNFKQELQNAFALSVNTNIPTSQNAEYLLQHSFMDAVNFAINQKIYSESIMDRLISEVYSQALGLSKNVKPEEKPKDEKTE